MMVGQVEALAEQAVRLIEREALFSADVDWAQARAELRRTCAAGDVSDLRAALYMLVKRAGGAHSTLLDPDGRPAGPPRPTRTAASLRPAPTAVEAGPTGRLLDGVGYLHVPPCPGGPMVSRRYAATSGRALRQMNALATGFVIDLRRNSGGNMWPMLAATAPLLDQGTIGYFVRPDGGRQIWSLSGRRVLLAGRRMARSRAPASGRERRRVAVLISGGTASSGEATAVAFRALTGVRFLGTPTHGFTSANQDHRLPDGSVLRLTSAYFADRAGQVYTGPIIPDELMDDPLPAALSWAAGEGRLR